MNVGNQHAFFLENSTDDNSGITCLWEIQKRDPFKSSREMPIFYD